MRHHLRVLREGLALVSHLACALVLAGMCACSSNNADSTPDTGLCAGIACAHGTCLDGTCTCEPGWDGAACDICAGAFVEQGPLCVPADACPDPAHCYYVSSTGTATWAGCSNIGTPCSWQTAMDNADAGDVVFFRGGEYHPGEGGGCGGPVMSPVHSGTDGRPITFRGYPGEIARIHDGVDPADNNCGTDPSGTQPAIGAYNKKYIIWDNFTLIRDLDSGHGASAIVAFDLCDHCAITNSELIGVAPHVDHTNGVLITVSNSTFVTIANNKMHDMVGLPEGHPDFEEYPVNTGALWIFDNHDIFIYNNDIYNMVNGVQWKDNPNRIRVYNNHIWNCSRAAINPGNGVAGTTDFFIHNNVIRDCAVALHSFDPPHDLYNLRFYNNTLYNSGAGSLAILGKPTAQPHRNTEIFNNILSNAGSGDPLLVTYYNNPQPDQLPAYADYNTYHGSGQWALNDVAYADLSSWRAASGLDLHSMTSDPQFINAGGTSPADYKLGAGSPARAAAPDHRDIDGDGDSTELINIGAYVTGEELIGVIGPNE